MGCPNLLKSVNKPACKSIGSGPRMVEKPYTPSPFQLKEYCKNKQHRKCPFYSMLPISCVK